jgi:hypothetical protein
MLGFDDVVRVTALPEIVGERNQGLRDFYGHLFVKGYNTNGEYQFSGVYCQVYGKTEKQCRISLQAEMRRRALEFVGAEILPLRTYGLVAHPYSV